MHPEPVHVGRGGAAFQDVVELEEAPAGVVEDPIQHNADAAAVRLVQQAAQGGIPAEDGIDLQVVVGMVAVVGGGLEDRRKVNGIDAQVLQVIQLFQHADQVAALESVAGGRGVPGFQVGWLGDLRIPGGCKPVREDLVKNSMMNPFGGGKGGHCASSGG